MPFFDPIRIGASGAVVTAFTVDRSLRFNDGDSPYLNRTPSSNPTSGQKVTFSIWFKISTLHTVRTLFANLGGGNGLIIQIDANDDLYIYDFSAATNGWQITSDFKLRDVSAWYHLVVAIDTTQATDSNRAKVYINGELKSLSSWSTGGGAQRYPAQNVTLDFNANGDGLAIGGRSSGSEAWDGYLAEVIVIDGQQLTQASFGETDSTTGQWNPIDTSGLTFGTNGFRLQFADNSGTTATTLGKDTSGNGNNFTPNNFSVAAGVENDSMEDTPTNNWCTLNPIFRFSGRSAPNFFNATLEINNTGGGDLNTHGTFAVKSGKYYFEGESRNADGVYGTHFIGVQESSPSHVNQGHYRSDGRVYDGSASPTQSGTTYDGTQTIGVAFDADTGKVWFAKNNTWISSGDPANGNNPAFTYSTTNHLQPSFAFDNTSSGKKWFANFGQRAFTYTPPTGFEALNSSNLSDPTIKLPNKHFETLTYTGNGGSNSITGLQFQPDWLWIKNRGQTDNHQLHDAIRGASKGLISNLTNAEYTDVNAVTAFDSNGFSMNNNYDSHNKSSETYVAWNWNAGDTDGKTYTVTVVDDSGNKYRFDGFAANAVTLDLAEGGTYIFNYPSAHPLKFSTTSDGTHGGGSEYTTGVTHNSSTQVTIVVAASAPQLYYYCSIHSGMGGAVNTNSTLGSSNFDGSIQSTAKVNATAGFSIVTYTGNGTGGATIGHGLGVAADWIIAKVRNASRSWAVGSDDSTWSFNLRLDENSARANTSQSKNQWYETTPTSTKFYVGDGDVGDYSGDTNVNGENYVAYCFSEVAGYSKFGLYKSNNSNDGTFIYLGFKPSWFLVKNRGDAADWVLWDNKRNTFNPRGSLLQPANTEADYSVGVNVDFVSNGVKLRGSSGYFNNPADEEYIYFAFAESTFKYARGV